MTVTGNGALLWLRKLWLPEQGLSDFLLSNIPGVRGLAPAFVQQSGPLK